MYNDLLDVSPHVRDDGLDVHGHGGLPAYALAMDRPELGSGQNANLHNFWRGGARASRALYG